MLTLQKKTLSRSEWSWLGERKQYTKTIATPCFTGVVSLLQVVSPPAPKRLPDGRIFADVGYQWLQVAPHNKNWWLTAVYNEKGELFESYLDLTLYNDFWDINEPCFIDAFLDVVAAPYEPAQLLDADELAAAVMQGLMTPRQAAALTSCAKDCIRWYESNREQYYKELSALRQELLGGLLSF